MCTFVRETNATVDDTLKRSMESLYSECGEILKRLPFHCLTGLAAHRHFGLLHLAMHIFEDNRAMLLFSRDVKTAVRIRNYRLEEDEAMVTLYVQTSGGCWWQTTMTWYDVANAWGFKDHRQVLREANEEEFKQFDKRGASGCRSGDMGVDSDNDEPLADTKQQGKYRTKWSSEEDATIIRQREGGQRWKDISLQLPGRSAMACRLRYQNYLEKSEAAKNKLASAYNRYTAEAPTHPYARRSFTNRAPTTGLSLKFGPKLATRCHHQSHGEQRNQ